MDVNISNQEWIFVERPQGAPDGRTFALRDCDMPVARDGQIIVEATYFSVDPYMRGRLSEEKSYAAGWQLGEPGEGMVTGIVVESHTPRFSKGDVVVGGGIWRRVFAAPAAAFRKVPDASVSLTAYLGVIGGTGLSAYLPIKHIGQPKSGETVFVSGAAGAVGSAACQIFKIFGCQVVGAAGSNEKVAFLESLGVTAFNYKSMSPATALAKHCPNGVDIYFDNVGGEMLDASLNVMNTYGRIIACGAISQYNAQNASEIYGLKNYMAIVKSQLSYQGFIVSRWEKEFPQARSQLAAWVKEGKLKHSETVVDGFENLGRAFQGLFTGENTGKMLVQAKL